MKSIDAAVAIAAGVLCFSSAAQAARDARFPTPFKHVVVIFQENRTPENLFQGLCHPPFYAPTGGKCMGPDWVAHVDLKPANVLNDISACKLPQVSWVIPIGQNSDHPGSQAAVGGPSWVASIVNAIGNDTACEGGHGITWDDWGGWYDHERRPSWMAFKAITSMVFACP